MCQHVDMQVLRVCVCWSGNISPAKDMGDRTLGIHFTYSSTGIKRPHVTRSRCFPGLNAPLLEILISMAHFLD